MESKNTYWNIFSHEAFKNIPPNSKEEIFKRVKEVFNYKPKVAILGKTGVGKSTLINALFGYKITKTSAISACTREVELS
ncbi:GTPase RsgA [Acetobacteraceae bacterium]|nr:GTPase RsgA [Acetobacteraceae bacterium]